MWSCSFFVYFRVSTCKWEGVASNCMGARMCVERRRGGIPKTDDNKSGRLFFLTYVYVLRGYSMKVHLHIYNLHKFTPSVTLFLVDALDFACTLWYVRTWNHGNRIYWLHYCALTWILRCLVRHIVFLLYSKCIRCFFCKWGSFEEMLERRSNHPSHHSQTCREWRSLR